MEDELTKIEMSEKLERARQKRGNLNISTAAGEVENKEGVAHDTTAPTDLPSDKLHHAFISHKKVSSKDFTFPTYRLYSQMEVHMEHRH